MDLLHVNLPNAEENFLSHPRRIVSTMEPMTDNPATASPGADTPKDDSEFAAAVFADPVGYLAGHGITTRLVNVAGVPIPKAA